MRWAAGQPAFTTNRGKFMWMIAQKGFSLGQDPSLSIFTEVLLLGCMEAGTYCQCEERDKSLLLSASRASGQ